MTCEICGCPTEAGKASCSDACLTELRRRRASKGAPRLSQMPVCPVCHCVRELKPGERVTAFRRRETCGDDACVAAWRVHKTRVSRAHKVTPAVPERVVAPPEPARLSLFSKRGVLARLLVGAWGMGLAGFEV
jgi:uncharacterized protein YbaA (DUF1428 family)